ncbi:MAG: CcmD family protein [Thermodesulfovibrionia bacterium]|nr:CcmD family protein [Thermodesulfovibrionia bacterium]
MENSLKYMFMGYSILWLIIFSYVFFIGKRQGDLKKEIDELRRIAEEK